MYCLLEHIVLNMEDDVKILLFYSDCHKIYMLRLKGYHRCYNVF